MNTLLKKRISICLVLCMLFSLLPVSALAEPESGLKPVVVHFVIDEQNTSAGIGDPVINVSKDATEVSAEEAQHRLDQSIADNHTKFILADPNAAYRIEEPEKGLYSIIVPVKKVQPLNLSLLFKDESGKPLGEPLLIPGVMDNQEKLNESQITFVESKIPDGYLLKETPDYTIPKDKNTLEIIVLKQNVTLVTLIATPKEAVQGVDAYSVQMRQDLSGKITVTNTWYLPKEGYELKRILAYGFNEKADYFEVENGDKLTPNKNTKHTIKYEYVSTEKNADIAVTAYPYEAIKGNSMRTISLSLDDKDSIKVPKATDVFSTVDGYEPAEIYASGFNGKNGAILVKEGDLLQVTGKTPELRYEYTKVTKTQRVNFLAEPFDAVTGSGSLEKDLAVDKNGKVAVPKDTDLFTMNNGYVLKEITATGFDNKTGTFTVKAGDSLTVTDKHPVLKYVYESTSDPKATSVVMTIHSKDLLVNGKVKTIDVAPLIKNERTYVPLRALVEAFGAKVDYYDENHTVIAELDGVKVIMVIGSKIYTVNGVSHTMDVVPFISNSRTMVPVRFLAEAFGIQVTPTYNPADGTTKTVEFKK